MENAGNVLASYAVVLSITVRNANGALVLQTSTSGNTSSPGPGQSPTVTLNRSFFIDQGHTATFVVRLDRTAPNPQASIDSVSGSYTEPITGPAPPSGYLQVLNWERTGPNTVWLNAIMVNTSSSTWAYTVYFNHSFGSQAFPATLAPNTGTGFGTTVSVPEGQTISGSLLLTHDGSTALATASLPPI